MILLRASVRHLARHPWQAALSVLGIALGVAVVVSVDLASESARRAFALAAEGVTGRATHEIVGGSGGTRRASGDAARARDRRASVGAGRRRVGGRGGRAGTGAPAARDRSLQRGPVPTVSRAPDGGGRRGARDNDHRAGRGAAEPRDRGRSRRRCLGHARAPGERADTGGARRGPDRARGCPKRAGASRSRHRRRIDSPGASRATGPPVARRPHLAVGVAGRGDPDPHPGGPAAGGGGGQRRPHRTSSSAS